MSINSVDAQLECAQRQAYRLPVEEVERRLSHAKACVHHGIRPWFNGELAKVYERAVSERKAMA